MKKTWLVIILAFLCYCTFAYTEEPRLLFGSGNDKFTYGISKNADDQLSYSGVIGFDFDRYRISLDMKAYTDRGSWPDGQFRNGRLDEVSLSTCFQNSFNLKDCLTLDLDPIIGVSMIGKCYFDFVQNFSHKNLGVDHVDIKYDWNKIEVRPIVGLNMDLNAKFRFLNFKAKAEYLNAILFNSSKKVSFQVSAFDDLFSFSAGYQINKSFSDSLTMDSVNGATEGVFVNFDIDAGVFVMDWLFYPNTGFGFGTYYIDVMPIFREGKSWKHTDVYFDHGLSSLYDMELLNASFKIPITEKIAAVCEVGYVSGFPKTEDPNARVQRNYALYEAGISYTPVEWYVSPFMQVQFGLGSFQIDYINSVNPKKSDEIIEVPAKIVWTADLRLGLSSFPEGFLAFGCTDYHIQLYAGTHIIPMKDKLNQILRQDLSHSENWRAGIFSPYVGFGVSIGVDVPQ